MIERSHIDHFLSSKSIAFAGVSRDSRKFPNSAFRELKKKGYPLVPVNPNAETVEGEKCFRSIGEIEPLPDAVLVMVPKSRALSVVQEAHASGIKKIWIQQGATSEDAEKFCKENNLSLISGECILMHAEPVQSVHRVHRWIWKLLGKVPA